MENWLKCFCLPEVTALLMALATFAIAYVLYRLILFVLGRLTQSGMIWKRLGQEIRRPLFWLLMELAFLFSLHLVYFSDKWMSLLIHGINIFLLGTLGWLAAAILHSSYHDYSDQMGDRERADPSKRTLFTQILFLYRIAMFVICVMTVGAILLTFPYIKSVGIGILGSAGIVGIALGIAARPILLNLMAGFQIAATKTVKMGDTLLIEGESARVESIHLTHVVVRTWDLRRIIVPISYFIDKPFQNWDATDPEIKGSLLLYCDYSLPVDALRKKMVELVALSPHWNKKNWDVYVTNCTEQTMEIRVSASADDARAAFELKAFLREKLIDFIQKEYPHALPCIRSYQFQGKE